MLYILYPAAITTAVALLAYLLQDYGIPRLQRWLDENPPDDNDIEMNEIGVGDAVQENTDELQ